MALLLFDQGVAETSRCCGRIDVSQGLFLAGSDLVLTFGGSDHLLRIVIPPSDFELDRHLIALLDNLVDLLWLLVFVAILHDEFLLVVSR